MSKTIEQQVQEIQRLEEMCDDDSDQIVAMYRRNLRTALQERDRIAKEEERERIKNIMLPWINDNQFLDDPTSEAFENAILQTLTPPLEDPTTNK